MAKKVSKRRAWTPAHVRTLKSLARKKKHAASIAKALKRSEACDAPKGIQYGIVPRFARLISHQQVLKLDLNLSPVFARGFFYKPPARSCLGAHGMRFFHEHGERCA